MFLSVFMSPGVWVQDLKVNAIEYEHFINNLQSGQPYFTIRTEEGFEHGFSSNSVISHVYSKEELFAKEPSEKEFLVPAGFTEEIG